MKTLRYIFGHSFALALSCVLLLVTVPAESSCDVDAAWPKNQTLGPSFSILSWNMQKAGGKGWQQDLMALTDSVELAFLQEASLQAGIPELLPDELTAVFAQGYSTSQLNSGVMTLGSAAPQVHCSYSAVEPWLRTPKAASVAEFALQGSDDRLLAVNLHAINFSLGLQSLREQLAPLVAQLAEHAGPAIVAGDFNTWSGTRQALVDRLMASQGLTQVAFKNDLRSRPLGRPLDHVYLRGLRAERAEVVAVASSDHNPIRLRLTLEP